MAGTCELHHDYIEDKIDDHEERLRNLEKASATVLERMDGTCRRLDGLIKLFQFQIGLWSTGLIGFFFWYIQSLSR